jgi:SAM-dependent methyltransferase
MINGILDIVSESADQIARVQHWDAVYERMGPLWGSWYQQEPRLSLELIQTFGAAKNTPIVDVGSGSSSLVGVLLRRGFSDISVLDVSAKALQLARSRLGEEETGVVWVCEDLLEWEPSRTYGVWHDRALFHFLVEPQQRERYRSVLRSALSPGGLVIMATFAPDGPERCSGLPVARYSAEGIVDALGPGFECLDCRREEHVTPSGTTQAFSWASLRDDDRSAQRLRARPSKV